MGERETMEFETIVVERPDPLIARIVMNRPEARNAQFGLVVDPAGLHPSVRPPTAAT